mmetsp:Transcript_16260/g.35582  ORF Transcript_16260/g.35582 Transcript_16260/m.35582 type:complete len:211 (+) Transcript_16260:171-803(+)
MQDLEKVTMQLRETASKKVTLSEISAADGAVWRAQREHMQLLELQEQQKAGSKLLDLERQLSMEQAAVAKSQSHEERLADELREREVALQAMQSEIIHISKEMRNLAENEVGIVEGLKAVNAEYQERQSALFDENQAHAAHEKAKAEEESRRSTDEAELQQFEVELDAARRRREAVNSELTERIGELKGLRRDADAAATLSDQAQRLLGK